MSQKSKEAGFGHINALDGLRAIAILMVLAIHGLDDVPGKFQLVASAGWSGVDLFFVLSGFLITGGLLRTKTASNYFRSFYGRRMLRIFPVFYLMLAITFGILPWFISSPPLPPVHDRIFYWLYLNNWSPLIRVVNTQYVGHFWSLAVEEQFYIFWPAVVLLSSRKRLCVVAGLCVLCAPILRAGLFASGVQVESIYRNTFCRIDPLMAGALCALLLTNPECTQWIKRQSGLLLCAGLLIWLPLMVTLGETYTRGRMLVAGPTINAVCFGMILLGCLNQSVWTTWLSTKPLRMIGVWSYGIYVYHLAFVHLCHNTHWIRPGLTRLCSEILMAISVAAISYHWMEKPILVLKHRFSPEWQSANGMASSERPTDVKAFSTGAGR